MEAKELMIGNLVKKGQVEMIANNCIWIHDLPYFFDEIEPIPLTEEWLVKFGFEIKQGRFGNEYFGKINLYTASDKKIVFCYDDCLKGINYVHQLQNLYFALIGEELTL